MSELTLKKAIEQRRSVYSIGNTSTVEKGAIEDIVRFAMLNTPSAFNSQSTRIVLLFEGEHKKFWDIVKSVLKEATDADKFSATEAKIESSFAAGYGTVLFYEDLDVIENLQKSFPSYAQNFPKWKHHTSAMHQYVIWTMLAQAGLGASLQHYNPLIDTKVAAQWNISPRWQLIAQMPLGTPLSTPDKKESLPLEGRFKTFG